jgi:DNA-binding IclR family transcriptional regulator
MIELLEKVAADGFAITKNVANSGIVALGAPVFDSKGNLILAVGCSEPLSRSSEEGLAVVRKRLIEVTSLMTRKLGGIPGIRPGVSAA